MAGCSLWLSCVKSSIMLCGGATSTVMPPGAPGTAGPCFSSVEMSAGLVMGPLLTVSSTFALFGGRPGLRFSGLVGGSS
ncbi:hypothetical protein BDW60DRAFT_185655 [Aspergillus nidulans var. acristatus]